MRNWGFPWHNDDCDMEFRFENSNLDRGRYSKEYWCRTHNQWVSEYPDLVTVVINYKQGPSTIVERKFTYKEVEDMEDFPISYRTTIRKDPDLEDPSAQIDRNLNGSW